MEERSPSADAASAPAAPSTPASPPESAAADPELDAALSALDAATPAAGSVEAPGPAAILALEPKPAPRAKSSNGHVDRKTSDAVANALLVAERAAQAAKDATDDAADDVADALLARSDDGGDDEAEIEDPEPSLSVALEEAQAAVRAAVKATDDAADHVADELLARTRGADDGDVVDEGAPAASRDEVAEDDGAGAEAALAAHRKAVASGRSTRAHPRVNVAFDVRYRKGAEQVIAKGRNVSVGGFFVETAKLLPEGEVFQAQLVFEGPRKVSVIAEAMWGSGGDPENPERFPSGMGCKFLDVDDKDVPFLQGLVDAGLAK